jgi:hypothetical protein
LFVCLFVAIDTFPCCPTFTSMFHNFFVVLMYPFFTFLFSYPNRCLLITSP